MFWVILNLGKVRKFLGFKKLFNYTGKTEEEAAQGNIMNTICCCSCLPIFFLIALIAIILIIAPVILFGAIGWLSRLVQ